MSGMSNKAGEPLSIRHLLDEYYRLEKIVNGPPTPVIITVEETPDHTFGPLDNQTNV